MRLLRLLRRAAVCLLFAGVPAWASQACPPAPALPDAQTARAAAADHGFLWRIDKDGRTSYLYGTLHVGRPAWTYPGPRVRQALDASDTLALELDLSDARTARELAQASRDAPPIALPDALRTRLARQVAAACLPEAALDGMHPLLQATTLAALVARHDGLHIAFAQELALSAYARARRRPVLGLESVQLQMRALLPRSEQEGLIQLDQTLQQLEEDRVRPVLRRVAGAWEQGRLDELEHYESWCDCVATPEERAELKRLNDDRNPYLAERIDALHQEGHRVFAAVGALHMTGPQGLPRLLAARGYRVERIPFAP